MLETPAAVAWAVVLGLLVAALIVAWPYLVEWWRSTREDRRREEVRRVLRRLYELEEPRLSRGLTAWERHHDRRCPFCGFDPPEPPTNACCSTQGTFREDLGQWTWDRPTAEPILEWMFAERSDG